jgi:hypothetical protein
MVLSLVWVVNRLRHCSRHSTLLHMSAKRTSKPIPVGTQAEAAMW